MDFLECHICNIRYDEEEHRPRHAPCGHAFCSACIRALIKEKMLVCPKCRQKTKVDVPDELPVSFGLIDVIRAFKSQNISLSIKGELKHSGASNADECKVHHKIISHRCHKCNRWLCKDCLRSHTNLTGCSTISSSTAVKLMKDKHAKDINEVLSNFEEGSKGMLLKIQECNNKIEENTKKITELKQQSEEHGKEISKIQQILEEGKQKTEDILKSKMQLSITNSPYAVMDGIEILEEMKQALHSWSITNLGIGFPYTNVPHDNSKELKEERDVNVEMAINNQMRHGQNYNSAFKREIEACYNTQSKAKIAKQQQTPNGTWDKSMTQVSGTASNSPDVICVESDRYYFFFEMQTLLIHNIKNFIQEKDKDKDFEIEGKILSPLLDIQKKRIRSFAESKTKDSFNSPGIFDFGVYLLSNGVPMDPLVNIYAYEVVYQVCQKANSTPLVDKLNKEVTELFAEQKELYTREDVKEEYNSWLKSYQYFLECAWTLVYCKQQFEKNNVHRALPLILRACHLHETLTNSHPHGPKKTLDGNVLWKYRRTCLLTLNEKLYNSFKTGNGQETVSELNSLIIPAMAQISTSHSKEDEDAIAKVKNKWCQLLGEDLGSQSKSQISEQILKYILIDFKDILYRNLPANIPRHNNVLALYKQYIDLCRLVYGLRKINMP